MFYLCTLSFVPVSFNDCCADYKAVCANASCANYGCVTKPNQLCFCDSTCERRGHCCDDKWKACGHHPGPSPGPGPPHGPVGPPADSPPGQFHIAPGSQADAVTVSYTTGKSFHATATCTLTEGAGGTGGGQTFTGTSSTYTDGGWVGMLHQVPMTGLKADGRTVYVQP